MTIRQCFQCELRFTTDSELELHRIVDHASEKGSGQGEGPGTTASPPVDDGRRHGREGVAETTASHDASAWVTRTLLDPHGKKVGRITAVYVDEAEGPGWLAVRTGFFGRRHFVTLQGTTVEGADLVTPWLKNEVQAAPDMGDKDGVLAVEKEALLRRYYGVQVGS